jgi:hypothetical protein
MKYGFRLSVFSQLDCCYPFSCGLPITSLASKAIAIPRTDRPVVEGKAFSFIPQFHRGSTATGSCLVATAVTETCSPSRKQGQRKRPCMWSRVNSDGAGRCRCRCRCRCPRGEALTLSPCARGSLRAARRRPARWLVGLIAVGFLWRVRFFPHAGVSNAAEAGKGEG